MLKESIKTLVKEAFKTVLREEQHGGPYVGGHYPTSDEVPIEYDEVVNNVNKCQLMTTNGKPTFVMVVQLTPKIAYGGVTTNGADWEILELDSNRSSYFKKFKNTIEDKFDLRFVDEDEAKTMFEDYMGLIYQESEN